MCALKKSMRILLVFFLMAACNFRAETGDVMDCTGVFFAELTHDIHQKICIRDIMYYQLKDNTLYFKVNNQEVAGNTVFTLRLNHYTGTGMYRFGLESSAHISLNVYGASSEFYDCLEGTMTVIEANKNTLKADFDLVMEGFYNKKTIRVRGSIRL